MTAAEALLAAALQALRGIGGFGVFEARPVQAALPYATVEIGPEGDWGHKSGDGREVRVAAVLHDESERAERLRRLMGEAEAALAALEPELGPWRLVTMRFLRSRVAREGRAGWVGVVEFRARVLKE